MLNERAKYLISIILIVAFTISSSACNTKGELNSTDNFWYSCNSFIISSVEGYKQNVSANNYNEGYYYLTIYGEKIDYQAEGPDSYCFLYKIDSTGNCCSKVSLPGKYAKTSRQIIVDNKLYGIESSTNTEYIIDINNGRVISEEKAQEEIRGYYYIDDGYAKITASKIIRCSKNGNETDYIDLPTVSGIKSLYQKQGRYYLMGGNIDHIYIYELNFENNQVEKVFENSIYIDYEVEQNGDLFFTNSGIYSLDLNTKEIIPLTKWNYVDIKPAYKATIAERNLSYGNGRFGKFYIYTDYEIELIVFKKISAEIYAGRTAITVGGYGVESSMAIKWAVYNFNTSQNEYRIYLDDYWNDYSYTSSVEAKSQIAKLIKYFSDGNAPDIYYGTNFDYRYMYSAGLVTDMLPIIESDPSFSLDELIPSIKNTITRNGSCYQIFSAYYFDGDFGLRSVFGDKNYNYLEIDKMAQENGLSVRGEMPAAEFADQIIRYSLENLLEKSSNNHIVSTEELTDIVEYSVRNGIPYGTYANRVANMESVHDRIDLTCRRTHLGNLYDLSSKENKLKERFVYLGFPSIYGSSHAAQPDGLVAISAAAKNPDACWQFIKHMLSEDVQKIEIGQGNNPVINKILDDFCYYAANPELVPETEIIWKSIVTGRDEVPDWIVSDYRSMVDSIDLVISYDWGLYTIICDEINSYYIQGKSSDEIASTLQSRLDIYVSENYT